MQETSLYIFQIQILKKLKNVLCWKIENVMPAFSVFFLFNFRWLAGRELGNIALKVQFY